MPSLQPLAQLLLLGLVAWLLEPAAARPRIRITDNFTSADLAHFATVEQQLPAPQQHSHTESLDPAVDFVFATGAGRQFAKCMSTAMSTAITWRDCAF
jgi:hypothetical protein